MMYNDKSLNSDIVSHLDAKAGVVVAGVVPEVGVVSAVHFLPERHVEVVVIAVVVVVEVGLTHARISQVGLRDFRGVSCIPRKVSVCLNTRQSVLTWIPRHE